MIRPDRIIRKAVRSRYLVTTTSEETFDGLLLDADARTVVLGNVEQVAADGSRLGVQGELVIPRDTVKYLQTVKS